MPRRASLMKAPKGRRTSTQGKVLGSTANESPSPGAPEQSEIPEGWQQASLGELCELLSEQVQPSEASGLHYVGLEHIDTGEPTLRRWGEPDEVRSAKNCFTPGDILYGKLRPYLDKAVIAPFKGICSTDILVFRARTGRADAEFLVPALHTNPFVQHATTTTAGVNHPRTSWGALKAFRMVVPPLAEQQAIAEVLRTVQRAKEATEKVIAATRQLKASLMKHLFTYGPVPLNQADRVPLKETETGAVPEHWRRSRVAELGRVVTGKTPSTGKPEYWNGDIPFITPVDLPNGIIRGAERSISEEGLAVVKELPRGAVAVSCIGYIGKVGLIDCERSATNQQINAVVPTREHDPRFLAYLFQTLKAHLEAAASMTTVPILNKSNFEDIALSVPELSEEREIAIRLAAVDPKLAAEEQRREALDGLFKSLLHHLMTGKVRLPEFVETG